MKDSAAKTDLLERRCPRLGGEVRFAYCQSCGVNGAVCYKILDCWWERFDVASYLKKHLSSEEFAALEAVRPPSKITSLIDLIQSAQRNIETSD